jgi:hypothetical protein
LNGHPAANSGRAQREIRPHHSDIGLAAACASLPGNANVEKQGVRDDEGGPSHFPFVALSKSEFAIGELPGVCQIAALECSVGNNAQAPGGERGQGQEHDTQKLRRQSRKGSVSGDCNVSVKRSAVLEHGRMFCFCSSTNVAKNIWNNKIRFIPMGDHIGVPFKKLKELRSLKLFGDLDEFVRRANGLPKVERYELFDERTMPTSSAVGCVGGLAHVIAAVSRCFLPRSW